MDPTFSPSSFTFHVTVHLLLQQPSENTFSPRTRQRDTTTKIRTLVAGVAVAAAAISVRHDKGERNEGGVWSEEEKRKKRRSEWRGVRKSFSPFYARTGVGT